MQSEGCLYCNSGHVSTHWLLTGSVAFSSMLLRHPPGQPLLGGYEVGNAQFPQMPIPG